MGRGGFQGRSHRHNLLNKADFQGFSQIDGAGAGDAHPKVTRPQRLLCLHQQGFQGLLGVGVVTAVLPKEDFPFLTENNQFYGGGADIDTGTIGVHDNLSFHSTENRK